MALEAFRGKMVFSRGSGVILDFLKWLEGFCRKRQGLLQNLDFFEYFCGFLECLEGLGPIPSCFFQTEGSFCKISRRAGTVS
jgi:hypothetical protein